MINPFKKKYNDEEMKLFSFMSQIKLFERLTYDEMSEFAPFMYLRTYNQNEVVFFTNDPSHALYIVKEGTISMKLDVNDRFEDIAKIHIGNTFGENCLLENTKRLITTIVDSEKAELYVIPQTNILEIMDDNPNIRAKIMTSFAEQHNNYTSYIFKNYRSNFGFFELGQVYQNMTEINQ